ncbi:MAG: ROK family protein [Lentisphaeraceae bacterium]|nr:ROK family protein [Lentisphaeraceae bacterium]
MKRTEVADYCQIRKSSVTSLVEELMEKKWIRLEDIERPRSPLHMNENYWQIVSLQLHPNKIIAAHIDLQGTPNNVQTITDLDLSTRENYIESILKVTKKFVKSSKNLFGIAVSTPGMVDPETGNCISALNLPDFENIPIKDILSREYSCPIVIENDVRASLYSNILLKNRSNKIDSALFVEITSGVGSTLMVNGAPYPGAHGTAGEIGHLVVGTEGRLCRCGQKDCLETYTSIPAICREIKKQLNIDLKSGYEIAQEAKNNADIVKVLDEACSHLAAPLASMIFLTDPEVMILGNQSEDFYKLMTPGLLNSIAKYQNGPAVRKLEVEISSEYSSLRGVAALLMDKIFITP